MPRAAPEWGAFRHGCRDALHKAFKEVATYRNMATKKFFKLIDI
jgi:hypothetical protein